MGKERLPQVVTPHHIDGIAALMVAETERLTKQKGERDTEFVKRIVSAYLNACAISGCLPALGRL